MDPGDNQPAPHILSSRLLTAVWAALACLTGLTMLVASMDLGFYNVLAALTIATIKALLVIAFFMHLKYEGRLLKGFLFLAFVLLAIFIGLTFLDLAFRTPGQS